MPQANMKNPTVRAALVTFLSATEADAIAAELHRRGIGPAMLAEHTHTDTHTAPHDAESGVTDLSSCGKRK